MIDRRDWLRRTAALAAEPRAQVSNAFTRASKPAAPRTCFPASQ